MHEQKAWINSRLLFMQWIAGEEKKKKKGGGRLTCDDGGLVGVKGSVVPVVVADGGWGGGLSSSPLCFSVLFSSSVFRSLCQHGFFLLCSGCVASLLFTVDHGGGGEARRQLLRFFLLPRVLPLSTTSSSLCFIPSPTLWFCWRWQRWWWRNGGAGWWWPKATVEREEQRWCPGVRTVLLLLCVETAVSVFYSFLPSLVLLPSLSLLLLSFSKILPPVFFVFNYSKHPALFCLLSFLFSFFPSLLSVFIGAQREGHLTSATEQGKVATLPLSWRRVGAEHGCPQGKALLVIHHGGRVWVVLGFLGKWGGERERKKNI